jgi:hypothetical protein
VGGIETEAHDRLREATVARAAGDVDAARAAYAAAYDGARQARDVDVMTEAALGLAAGQMWGTLPGRAPAFLHEAYELARGEQRTRLAVALARAWVYAGDSGRAVVFADEAVASAETSGAPALLAEALDAQLLVHWGPDDLDDRLSITSRLEDTVAHVADVEARLSAHLWRLTTALETLDVVGVQRQLRALDLLAEESESARVRFFAASRRGMHALLVGDLAAATARLEDVRRFGTAAGEPDTFALDHTLAGGLARQHADHAAMAAEAEVYEAFGTGEGAPSVTAQAAVLWLESGDADRASSLLRQVAGSGFAHLTRDVEWLLTIVSLTQVAAAVGATDLTASAAELLRPYAGRAVVNAGAVTFEGVVDDYLARAYTSLGRDDEAARSARAAAAAYGRLDAAWWATRLAGPHAPPAGTAVLALHLHPSGNGMWLIGPHDRAVMARETKGFTHLRTLLRNPGLPVTAVALSSAAAAHSRIDVAQGSLGDVIDRRALDAYRRRLAEIDAELDEAAHWSDSGRTDALAVERDALLEQVASATGLGGRRRQVGGSAERARVAVRKAIAAAIARVDDVDAATGRLLHDTIRTGTVCTYEPDPHRPVRWELD